jgi:hypothetical protein
VVVVAGAWSFSFGEGDSGDVGWRVMFWPSAPLPGCGSGAAGGIPCAVGDSDFFCGECVAAGG